MSAYTRSANASTLNVAVGEWGVQRPRVTWAGRRPNAVGPIEALERLHDHIAD